MRKINTGGKNNEDCKECEKVIDSFTGEYSFLSNFHPCTISWQGRTWSTVEHAYQAAKTRNIDYQEVIRNAPSPSDAKKLGRKVRLRGDWDEVKVPIMCELVYLKFTQNPALADLLIKTGSAELVEGNYWHDNFWGNCVCEKCSNRKGSNALGIILMNVRDDLMKGEEDE